MENSLKTIDLAVVIQRSPNNLTNENRYLHKDQATELLQKIGQNIALYYPQITRYGMIGVGGLYYLNQIIRPGFPIYRQLFELSKIRFRANNFKPLIIGIGTEEPEFEISHFNKEPSPYPELLEVLPFTVVMPDLPESEKFIELLESELITKAHLSGQIVEDFQVAFQHQIENISIVTLADLNGLFASQLIQIGLEELWEIIQAVIFDQTEKLRLLGSGHILYWKLDEVVLYTAHPSIYEIAMKDYVQTEATYHATTERLEQLFKMHKIPYSKAEVMDSSFFESEVTIDKARKQLNSHIKAL